MKNQKSNPTLGDLYMGGKYPEFTVFYNVAFFRMAGFLNHLRAGSYEKDKNHLESSFKTWLNKIKNDNDDLPSRAYSELRRYLWKGYLTEKNTSGYELTTTDINYVREMLKKLYNIRNFHSHIWHNNNVLEFSPGLKSFIEDLHDHAKNSFAEKYMRELDEYVKKTQDFTFFCDVDGSPMITQEGRTFFLSFFLTRGEMSRFLQQKRGSKRNDKPEFKIKQEVYRYYTHRDGAARHHYGWEDDMLNTLPEDERKEVLNKRQAYRITRYLSDVPLLSNEPELFPLILQNGQKAKTAGDLVQWCKENDFLKDFKMNSLVKKIEKPIKGRKVKTIEIEKQNVVEIHTSGSDYVIHIGTSSFHRLIMDCIRKEDQGAFISDNIKKFSAEREYLLEMLDISTFRELTENVQGFTLTNELDEYYRYKLWSGEKLKRKMGAWLSTIDNKKHKQYETSVENLKESIRKEPIEVSYRDFFYREGENPRPSERFTEFAVKYLIDFGLVPEWEWLVEKFDTELKNEKEVSKSVKFFSSTIPNDARLSIKNDHIIVRVKHDINNPPVRFLLGHRTIKNLIAAHFLYDTRNNRLPHFFKSILSDLKNIREKNNIDNLQTLTSNEIPESLLQSFQNTSTKVKQKNLADKAEQRIKHIVEELEKAKIQKMNRADKNRQIMRCYKYFDWEYPNDSQFKFLRKDEYQRMSVFHYCLEKRKPSQPIDRGRYSHLIKDVLPHMPKDLQELLKQSSSIDDLLDQVTSKTIKLLKKWQKKLPDMEDSEFEKVLGRLGIPMYGNNQETNEYIPFNIHPILPVRFYSGNKDLVDLVNVSFSAQVRKNQEMTTGLENSHYNFKPYIEKYFSDSIMKSQRRKIIGKMNELLTRDALLWKIAREYLKKSDPAIRDITEGKKNNEDGTQLNVNIHRQHPVKIEFEVPETGKVEVSLKIHQLDDFLLVESKPVIEKAVKQLIRRINREVGSTTAELEVQDGKYIISYDDVFKEIQRIQNQSINWAENLLQWERKIVTNIPLSEREQYNYIDFSTVLEKAQLQSDSQLYDTLKKIRNAAFHAEIPDGWSYEEIEQNKELCSLLGFSKKVKYNNEKNNDGD